MKRYYFIQKILSGRFSNSGLTLAELLMSIFVLVPIFLMTMLAFINSMRINDLARNRATALASSLNRIAVVQNTAFADIQATYHNTTFTAPGLNGIGSIRVEISQPNVLKVTTTFCWIESNGRLIGEDANLNGQLDLGEDENANGELDSPVKLVTVIYNV